jgi:DNA-binding NtrC family response regulator
MALKMLVIDDDDDVLESCRVIFTGEGYDVVTTNSPDQGLQLLSDSNFDVVLCDWKMPHFDGMVIPL